ncbi:Tape measure protein (TMP), partial [Durusdinium trenchii]
RTRQLPFQIDIGAVRRVKKTLEVDLLKPNAQRDGVPLVSAIYGNIELFVDVLYVLCSMQTEIDDEAFASELTPEAYKSAREQFFAEWIDFFLRSEADAEAASLQKQIEAMRAAMQTAFAKINATNVAEHARQKIEAIDFDQLVARAEARQRHDWRIVSHLLAGIANGPLKSRHGRLFTADDFDRSDPLCPPRLFLAIPMSRAIRAGRAFVELFADKERLARDLRVAERTVRQFGMQVSNIGRSLATVGALAAAAFVPVVTTFAGFQEQMSTVAAVTGATGEQLSVLTAKARELGAATSFSAQEAAQGMKFLGMAGFETEEILAGIPAVLDLVRAGAVELGLAADIASDVSSAFGLAADEIGRVADVMAKAATSANVTIEGLGESFKFAAPAGAAAGQSIEEVTAALATLGSNGLKGSIAGRNLAIIFKQLAFGEASKAAQILIGKSAGFEDMRKALDAATGSSRRMSDIMADNLAGDFRRLISTVQETALALGTALEPSLRQIVQSLIETVQGLTDWIKEHPRVVTAATAMAAAIGGVGTALLAIGTAATAAAVAIGSVRTVQAFAAGVAAWLARTIFGASSAMKEYSVSATAAATSTNLLAIAQARAAITSQALTVATRRIGSTETVRRIGDYSTVVIEATRKTSLWRRVLQVAWRVLSGLGQGIARAASAIGLSFVVKVVAATVVVGGLLKALAQLAGPTLREVGATLVATMEAALGIVGRLARTIGEGLVAAIDGAAAAFRYLLEAINAIPNPAWLVKLLDFGIVRERERGRKLDAQLAESRKRLGIGPKPPAKQQDGADAAVHLPDGIEGAGLGEVPDLAQEDPAAEVARALASFAESVQQSIQTPQQEFEAYTRKLREAFREGLLTAEEATRAHQLAQERLQQQLQQIKDAKDQEAADRRQAAEERVRDRADADLRLTRAAGNLLGELATLRRASREAQQQGLTDLAGEFKQQELETLLRAGSQIDDAIAQAKQEADLVTGSAREAAIGLGTRTIDGDMLKEQRGIHAGIRQVREELSRIREAFED